MYRVPENRNKQEINDDIKMCLYCNWKKANGLHHQLQKSLRMDLIHMTLSLSKGLDLKVTIFYTGLNITICLTFAEISHSTVYYVEGHNSLFSDSTGRKNRSFSSQNIIKDKCGHSTLNIATLYETCLNLIQIQQQPILISVFII